MEHFVHYPGYPVLCKECGELKTKLFTLRPTAKVMPAEGITLKNLPGGPKTFHSFKDMSRYANEHSLEIGALL